MKLAALFKYYEIATNDKNKWCKLSIMLARDLVPGMQMLGQEHRKTGPKEKKIWPDYKYARLAVFIDAERKKAGVTIDAAAAALVRKDPQRWGREWRTLVVRYHEGKRAMRERRQNSTLLSMWLNQQEHPDK